MKSRYWLSVAMRDYGGAFIRALGVCILRADDNNYRRICEAFPEYVATYQKIADKLQTEEENQL